MKRCVTSAESRCETQEAEPHQNQDRASSALVSRRETRLPLKCFPHEYTERPNHYKQSPPNACQKSSSKSNGRYDAFGKAHAQPNRIASCIDKRETTSSTQRAQQREREPVHHTRKQCHTEIHKDTLYSHNSCETWRAREAGGPLPSQDQRAFQAYEGIDRRDPRWKRRAQHTQTSRFEEAACHSTTQSHHWQRTATGHAKDTTHTKHTIRRRVSLQPGASTFRAMRKPRQTGGT